MPKEPLEKKTLNFRKGDWDFLTETYGGIGRPTSDVVRQLVSNFVDRLRAASDYEVPEVEDVEVKL